MKRVSRKARKMSDKSPSDDEFAVNPAAQAAEIAATSLSVADDELRDGNGNRVALVRTREEVRANRLGTAAGSAVYDARARDELARLRAEAAGLGAEHTASEARRDTARADHTVLDRAWRNTFEIGSGILARKRKRLALVAKPAFVTGDSAVMAVLMVRSGAPIWLAVLLGISMALSILMVGSQFGQQLALASHRRLRGPAPKDSPPVDRDLYDDGRTDAELQRWLVLGLGTAAALLVAVMLIGVGQGDTPALAFGYGLLTSLTFGGAAGAEAYGTNAVAERREHLESQLTISSSRLAAFEQLAGRAATATELANSLALAAEHGAFTAAVTTEVIADRTPDNAPVFGHAHPEPPEVFRTVKPGAFPPLDDKVLQMRVHEASNDSSNRKAFQQQPNGQQAKP